MTFLQEWDSPLSEYVFKCHRLLTSTGAVAKTCKYQSVKIFTIDAKTRTSAKETEYF